jgi:hypothetical protein
MQMFTPRIRTCLNTSRAVLHRFVCLFSSSNLHSKAQVDRMAELQKQLAMQRDQLLNKVTSLSSSFSSSH